MATVPALRLDRLCRAHPTWNRDRHGSLATFLSVDGYHLGMHGPGSPPPSRRFPFVTHRFSRSQQLCACLAQTEQLELAPVRSVAQPVAHLTGGQGVVGSLSGVL